MIEVIDETTNQKLMALIISSFKYGNELYCLYSIKRDEENDNIFVSKLIKNSLGYTMDNNFEGGEKEAIKGAKKHIKNDSPLLMIAVYHKHNDIWEIPKMIEEINSNYDFYLRYNGGCIFPTETTLICKVKD